MVVCTVVFAKPKRSLVYLERSATLSFDEKRLPGVQILRGNVRFRHDSALMYCDSAYFYEKKNSLHAFGHVHLVQGDSLEGWGDVLFYDGNTKMARFRRNVRLVHGNTTLTTDSLNYNRAKDIAYYFSGGKIQDDLNTLTSLWGQYTPYDDQAMFRGEVKLVNDKFTLTTDTLCYNTASYQADIVSPTEIIYEEETTILSSHGWYNTQTERSMLLDRSLIIHQDGMTLTGDTIYYDKKEGYGHIRGWMESIDSTHHMTLYGHKGEMWEENNSGYATDSAMLVEWSDSTKMTYLHADTLFTNEIPYTTFQLVPGDSILVDSTWIQPAPDTTWIDTSYVLVRAYYNARMWREDIQLVCDSMRYNGKDSVAILCGDPVCWNSNNQVSADTVEVYFKNNEADHIYGVGNAIVIKQEGDKEFNQMAGKEMYAYLKDGKLDIVDVMGNAETVFYPREEDGTYLGLNRTQSSFVKVFLAGRTIERVLFTTATTGTMMPMSKTTEADKYLVTFFWAENERPHQPNDIFDNPERTPRPDAQAISAAAAEEDEEEEEEDEQNNKRRRR